MVPIVYDPKTGIGTPDINFTPAAEAHDLNLPVTALAADPNLARFTGFNRTRRVIGETTKIPAPSTDVPYMPIDPEAPQGSSRRQLVSLYTLQYGPMDTQYFQPVVYSGQPLERTPVDHDLTQEEATDLGIFRYGVAYQRDRIVIYLAPATYDRLFKIQFSYTINDATGPFRAQSMPDAVVLVKAGDIRTEAAMPGNATPEQGEEILAQAFMQIPVNEPFSERDPFQYKLLNNFAGIIGFNPLASLVRQGDTNRPLTAKVDYDVADWHVVSEDVTVPQEAPFRVKLTLNFLKHAGDVQDNQETYAGLLPTPGLNGVDLVVLDLDRGVTIDNRTLVGEVANDNGSIDYRSGTITFSPRVMWSLSTSQQPESIAGQHLRVYYRTEDEFALQVQKAFTNYLRSANPYTVTAGQYGQERFGYLLFPASDSNQSVLVDYSFTEVMPDGTEFRRRVAGEMQPVRDPTPGVYLDAPQGAIPSVPTNLWFVRLNNAPAFGAMDSTGRANIVPGSIVVHAVRGVSMRSRAVWREGSRWRRLETTTYLSRPGA